MGRLILIVLVVLLLLWLLRRALAAGRRQDPPGGGAPDLVSCARCGVNLPKAEARSAGGRHYCSEEHWRLGPRE